MGHAADLALGIALARPDRRVICLNGDGSMLMSLGTLATIAQCRAANLILFIAQNDTYEITGNQPVPGARRLDFAGMARAADWPRAFTFDEARDYESQLDKILRLDGPVMVVVRVAAGDEGPITRGEKEGLSYLRPSLAESAHRLRDALGLVPSPY